MSVIGLATPNLPRKSMPVFPFPIEILLLVWIPFPVKRSYLDLPALVTGLPWRSTVLYQDGSRISFPGRWEGTQLAGQIGATLRYGLYQSPYRLPAKISSNYSLT